MIKTRGKGLEHGFKLKLQLWARVTGRSMAKT